MRKKTNKQANDNKKPLVFVNAKGEIRKDGKYIFPDDGYEIQKGDLINEYMKSCNFVPAESVGKVGIIVGKHNVFLTLSKY